MDMKFLSFLVLATHVMVQIATLPLDPNEPKQDLLQASGISLQDMANVAMSPHLEVLNKSVPAPFPMIQLPQVSAQIDHSVQGSKDTLLESLAVPLEVKAETGALGAKIPAGAAIKGSVVGSALATPVILKAVALPGIAAGKTAGLLSLPHLLLANAKSSAQLLAANVRSNFEDQANQLSDLLVEKQLLAPVEAEEGEKQQISIMPFNLNEGLNNAAHKVVLLKAGALGAATKGLVMAKKGAYVAGRVILKPIAILTGIHLKMIGSGLTLGGKLIGGTGAGIAKAGTAVKFTGLGAIGLGASAVSWGLDKSTIDSVDTRVHASAKIN